MFSELMKRSNAVWLYNTGRFAEERRTFLCDMVEHGRSGWHTLRQTNRLLLAVAERVNVRQRTPVTERQIVQAAEDWTSKTRSATCSDATRGTSTKRFVFVAKQWLQFLGKWHEPDRDSPFKPQLDSLLAELRDQRGYSPDTISTRRSALNLFFEWLEKLGISLADMSPQILDGYFVQNEVRDWKKSTVKAYGNSVRAFLRYAARQGWCASELAETIHSPRIYAMTGLPQGPNWDQIQRLIATLDTERPSHIRDRAIVLLLAVYGLRIGEVCGLKLDDLDWDKEKLLVRRLKSKRTQEFPLNADVGNAVLKYLQKVRPQCSSRSLFLSLRRPFRPMNTSGASSSVARHVQTLGPALHYGAHSLRHACASHLLDEGFSMKEIGDHLGHRSPRIGMLIQNYHVDKEFEWLRKEAGVLRFDNARYQPRLHDFRHTFAVARLLSWYREGKDVQRMLPLLSTYLGHCGIEETSVYLQMTRELLQAANRCFERYAFAEVHDA